MADDALPEFDRALGLPIFLCQRCLTYLALMTQEQLKINVQRRAIFFPPLRCINLLVDPPENHFTQNSTTWLARVFCRGCYTMMGYKIVRENNPDRPDQEGTVVMDMDVLLLWDGSDLFSLMVRVLMWPPPPLPPPPPPPPPPTLLLPADPAPPAPQPPSSTSSTSDHQRFSSLVPLPMLQLLLPPPSIMLLPAPALHPPSSIGAANGHLMFSSLVRLPMPPQPYQPPLVLLLPPPPPIIPLVPAPASQQPSPMANSATDPTSTTDGQSDGRG